jgi:hypothetical protein
MIAQLEGKGPAMQLAGRWVSRACPRFRRAHGWESLRASIVLACLAVGCASPPPQASSDTAPGPAGTLLIYEGPVAITGMGGSTFTTVSVEGRGAVGVVGELEPELRALSGARVHVEGPAGTGYPGQSVDVRSYAVLEVNGERPYVGVLVSTPQGLLLDRTSFERDRLPLSSYPGGFMENVGAKVWVTGPLNAGSVQVQSFGIIRPR